MREVDYERISRSFFSRRWTWTIDAKDTIRATLRDELIHRLPHIDPVSWEARCAIGGIYLAGRAATLDSPLIPECRVEYYEPKAPLERLASLYPGFDPNWVIYSDGDIGVVYKPAGLPTTAARDQQLYNLQRYLSDHFGAHVHTPSRLDTAVAGLLVCSFSSRMNRYLQKAYERKWLEKYYLAQVESQPCWRERMVDRSIARDPRHPVLRRCVDDSEVGEVALTKLARIDLLEHTSMLGAILQAEPLTGRTHQIRLHCSSENLPIVGDPYYGGREAPELRLVSYALRLFHPYRREEMTFELPPQYCPRWLHDSCCAPLGIRVQYRERGQ